MGRQASHRMGQAVVDLNLLPICWILEVEKKERELNRCRTLAGLERSDDTVVDKSMTRALPHQLTARLSAFPKYFGNASKELKITEEAFERFET